MPLRHIFAAACLSAATMTPAFAEFVKIDDRASFATAISGKSLTRTGIRLNVSKEGRIEGRAFGRAVSGNWEWRDGFFCRDLFWGKRELGYNCQQVARKGDALRFTSDMGSGEFADLFIR